jgi:hypothetical protein
MIGCVAEWRSLEAGRFSFFAAGLMVGCAASLLASRIWRYEDAKPRVWLRLTLPALVVVYGLIAFSPTWWSLVSLGLLAFLLLLMFSPDRTVDLGDSELVTHSLFLTFRLPYRDVVTVRSEPVWNLPQDSLFFPVAVAFHRPKRHWLMIGSQGTLRLYLRRDGAQTFVNELRQRIAR